MRSAEESKLDPEKPGVPHSNEDRDADPVNDKSCDVVQEEDLLSDDSSQCGLAIIRKKNAADKGEQHLGSAHFL